MYIYISILNNNYSYIFHLYAVFHILSYTPFSMILNIGCIFQLSWAIASLCKTYFGGYHSLRHMLLGFGITNILYSMMIPLFQFFYKRYKNMTRIEMILLFVLIVDSCYFNIFYFLYPYDS